MQLIITIIQTILHYLGLAGIILGIVAFILGSNVRGWELLLGGISIFVLKYIIGVIYFYFAFIWMSRKLKKR